MEIAKNRGIYEIKGIIRTLKEVEEIKEIIKDDSSELIIKITDSYILPSALIGFLMKQKEENNKEVTLLIKDENLFEMLMDLSLDEEFLIEKV
jgi:hypothetical protein